MVDLQYLKRSTLSDFLCVHRALPVCSPCVHSPFTVGSQSVYIALTIYSVFTYCACIQRSILHQRHHFNNNLCTPKNNPEVLRINRFQKNVQISFTVYLTHSLRSEFAHRSPSITFHQSAFTVPSECIPMGKYSVSRTVIWRKRGREKKRERVRIKRKSKRERERKIKFSIS